MGQRWKDFRSSRALQLTLLVAIFLISLATFNVLFSASTRIEYFKEFTAALIGVLITAVVTMVLLTEQSTGEEVKDTNVEIFKTKLRVYDEFLTLLVKYLRDSKLSRPELHQLQRALYRLSLVSSEKTTGTAIAMLRSRSLGDTDCEMVDVLNAFRQELSLRGTDPLSHFDMEGIDSLVSGATNLRYARQAQRHLKSVWLHLASAINATSGGLLGVLEGDGYEILPAAKGAGCEMRVDLPSGLSCVLWEDYDDEPELLRSVDGYVDLTELPGSDALRAMVTSLGFQPDEESPDKPGFILNPDPKAEPDAAAGAERVWTFSELAAALLQVEHFVRPEARFEAPFPT